MAYMVHQLPTKTVRLGYHQGTHITQDNQNFRINCRHNGETDVYVEYDGSYSNQVVQIGACETDESAGGRTELRLMTN